MTVYLGEQGVTGDVRASLRTIATELKKANRLKALQMRREFKDDANEIKEIMEEK